MAEQKKLTQKAMESSKENAEGLGYAAAVLLPWITNDLIGVQVPIEVLSVGAAIITSIAVRIKEQL